MTDSLLCIIGGIGGFLGLELCYDTLVDVANAQELTTSWRTGGD